MVKRKFVPMILCLFAAVGIVCVMQLAAPFVDSESGLGVAYAADDSDFYIADADGKELAGNQDEVMIPGASEMLGSAGIYVHICDPSYVEWGDRVGYPTYMWTVTLNGEVLPSSDEDNEIGYTVEQVQRRTADDPWDVFKITVPHVIDDDRVSLVAIYQTVDIDEETEETTSAARVRRVEITAVPEGTEVASPIQEDDSEVADDDEISDDADQEADKDSSESQEEDADGNPFLIPIIIVVVIVVCVLGGVFTYRRNK